MDLWFLFPKFTWIKTILPKYGLNPHQPFFIRNLFWNSPWLSPFSSFGFSFLKLQKGASVEHIFIGYFPCMNNFLHFLLAFCPHHLSPSCARGRSLSCHLSAVYAFRAHNNISRQLWPMAFFYILCQCKQITEWLRGRRSAKRKRVPKNISEKCLDGPKKGSDEWQREKRKQMCQKWHGKEWNGNEGGGKGTKLNGS